MAIIACPHCGQPVSERAFQCPACQQALNPSQPTHAQAHAQTPEAPIGKEFGYKPATIVAYSHHLISIAQLMTIICTLTGGYLGWKMAPLMSRGEIPSDGQMISGMLIGGLTGFLSVAWIAFLYIYVAQLSLCLLQVEKNTRRR